MREKLLEPSLVVRSVGPPYTLQLPQTLEFGLPSSSISQPCFAPDELAEPSGLLPRPHGSSGGLSLRLPPQSLLPPRRRRLLPEEIRLPQPRAPLKQEISRPLHSTPTASKIMVMSNHWSTPGHQIWMNRMLLPRYVVQVSAKADGRVVSSARLEERYFTR